jgi:hypothetical protein
VKHWKLSQELDNRAESFEGEEENEALLEMRIHEM